MEEFLIDFLLDLNEQGLINNHDFDYEKVARAFVNKDENKQLTIPVVGVTLPNIDEINKVLKNRLEDLEYREKLDGYEMTAYRRGFTYCLKWLGNKLTKGN